MGEKAHVSSQGALCAERCLGRAGAAEARAVEPRSGLGIRRARVNKRRLGRLFLREPSLQ